MNSFYPSGNAPIVVAGMSRRKRQGAGMFRPRAFYGRFNITGTTKDSTGTPVGNCDVHLFDSASDLEIAQTTSNGLGVYTFSLGANAGYFYVVAYKPGSPDIAGTTVNTLSATSVDPGITGTPATGYNLAIGLANWRTARASAGTQLVHTVAIGDSITEGYQASDRESLGYVALERARLQSVYSGGGKGLWPTRVGLTTRFTYVGTWGDLGHGPCGSSSHATGSANTMTATVVGDRLIIGYNEFSYTGDFVYTVDGGAPVTVTCPSNAALTGRIYTASLGTNASHTIVIKGSDVASKYTEIWGVGGYIGATGILYHNLAINGTKVTEWVDTATDRTEYWAPLGPALVTIGLDTNDFASQTDLATYQTELTTLITTIRGAAPSASILFIGENTRDQSHPITQQQYHDTVQGLCDTYGCAFIDIMAIWGSSAAQIAAGYVADGIHPTDLGHAAMASILDTIL